VHQAPACLVEVQLVASKHTGYNGLQQLANVEWAAHLERMAWVPAQLSGGGQRAAASPHARAVSLDASCWMGGGPLTLDALTQVFPAHL
jgi:hypothetical protein